MTGVMCFNAYEGFHNGLEIYWHNDGWYYKTKTKFTYSVSQGPYFSSSEAFDASAHIHGLTPYYKETPTNKETPKEQKIDELMLALSDWVYSVARINGSGTFSSKEKTLRNAIERLLG